MPRSFDFNWNEGEEADAKDRYANYQPPPAAGHAVPDLVEPDLTVAQPETDQGVRFGRLGLLAIGIALGMVVGLAVLGWQGQRAARGDFAPLFALQQQALAASDEDIYRSLFDENQPEYREAAVAAMTQTALLFDADSPPRLRGLRISGDTAEAEVESRYQGKVYRRVEMLRRSNGQWRLAPPNASTWGEMMSVEGENITLHLHRRDASLTRLLPQLQAITQSFCRRYNPPPPCQIDLTLTAEASLSSFLPSHSDWPAEKRIVVVSGQAQDGGAAVDKVASASNASSSLHFLSPRFVGLSRNEPHPLWWLGISLAIGDVIAQRALWPLQGDELATLTARAALTGDVVVWAERFSGVLLPAGDEGDPLTKRSGRGLFSQQSVQRQAARAFGLALHSRFGEAKTLAWLLSLRGQDISGSSPAIDGMTIDQIRQLADR